MAFKISADGTVASAKSGFLASKSGIPAMYGTGDYTTLPSNETIIEPTTTQTFSNFGGSVAIGSGVVVVGASNWDETNFNFGRGFIFDLNGNQLSVIDPTSNVTQDQVGSAVAVGNSRALFGAVGYGPGYTAGAVYQYSINGTEQQFITVSDTATGDYVGGFESIAIGSGRIVMAAPLKALTPGSQTGQAYIFDLEGNELKRFTPSDSTGADRFGYSLAVASNRVVIGSSQEFNTGSGGKVHVFDTNGSELFKITDPDDITPDHDFGRTVAAGQNRIVVGARGAPDGAKTNVGTAYIYDMQGTLINQVFSENKKTNDNFGVSVAVGSGRILVTSQENSYLGAAYVYDLDGNLLEKIENPGTTTLYGLSVAVNNGKIAIGDNRYNSQSGRVFLYDTPNVITPYDVKDWEYGY